MPRRLHSLTRPFSNDSRRQHLWLDPSSELAVALGLRQRGAACSGLKLVLQVVSHFSAPPLHCSRGFRLSSRARGRMRCRPQLVVTSIRFFWPAVRAMSVRDRMKRLASGSDRNFGTESSSSRTTRASVGLYWQGGLYVGGCAVPSTAATLLRSACPGLDCFGERLPQWRCPPRGAHDCHGPCGQRRHDDFLPRPSRDAARWLRAARSAPSSRTDTLKDWHIRGPLSC